MKSLEEYIELSKKIQADKDITMIKPKNKKGSGLTTTLKKAKRNIKKLALLPDTYLETRDELVERQEALLKKYEKIQELRKKARNIPYTSLIKEYQQILGKDYVPELDTDPGDVVESYIVRGKGTPTYHYYYRFKQDSSIPIEQYLPLMKEVECLENRSGDMFTFRFHVYQKNDGILKVQGLDKYDYNQVEEAFKNVLEITKKTTKKSGITISSKDFEIIDSLGMFTNNELYPYKIENYNAVNGNTQIKINRITRQKMAEKGGGLKPFSFKVNTVAPIVKIPLDNALTTIIEEEEEEAPINIPEPIIESSSKLIELKERLNKMENTPLAKSGELKKDGNGLRKNNETRKDRNKTIESINRQIKKEKDIIKMKNDINERSLDLEEEEEMDKKSARGGSLTDNMILKEKPVDLSKNLLWRDSTIKKKYKIL